MTTRSTAPPRATCWVFRSTGYNDIADYNGNEFASHWLEKFLQRP